MAARRGGDHPNGPDAAPACGWPAAPAPTAQPGAQGRGPDGGATDRQPHAPPTEDTRGEDERERAGVDQRRRGWFWHWNSVVTQYAPLIGLKGVGLLNSYTVWTDRRDESPHRGYAFPSQQSEADFYGEERSELITINKILVALDLIEIRKEMVARTDERGRRWRVPHNLYRVKDRPLGVALRAEDVLCVTSLACDDPAVYRHVRRIFSPRFKPIDRDNVWHAILAELDGHPLWQAMRERTAAQESRASARSRAGHRTRAAREGNHDGAAPTSGQLPDKLSVGAEHKGLERGEDATIVDRGNDGLLPQAGAVARTNDGSSAGVAGSNDGSEIIQPTSGAASNTGQVPSVAPSNSTHHQPLTTTTTTTSPDEDRPTPAGAVPHAASASGTRALDVAAPVERPARPRAQLRLPGELALGGAGVGARDGAPAHDAERANAPPGEIASAAARSTGEAGSVAPDSGERQAAPARGASDQQGDGIEAARRGATAEGESGSRNTDGEHRDVAGSGNEGWIVDVEIAAATDGGSPPGARAGAGDGVGRLADAAGGGPLGDPSPLVVSLFEAANDRRSSALERILLGELERDAEPAAGAAGSSGEEWVAAALREAVSSGSSFVAPKRVREIIARWSRETGGPGAGRTGTGERLPAGQPAGHAAPEHAAHPPARASPGGVAAGSKTVASSGAVRLPGGADGALIWDQALADLARALDRTTFERLLAGSALVRFRRGVVEVHVQSAEAAEKLSAEYRGLVERQLNARLPRPVAVTFLSEPSPVDVAGPGDASAADLGNLTIIISRADYDLATRVWQALRNDLASSLSARDLDGLGAVTPLGEDAAGAMLLGTATSRALRLVDGRCRPEIERALSALLGRPVTARAVSSSGWTVEPAD